MSTFYTVPKGPLISFGGITFISGHSLLEPGWGVTTTPELGSPMGSVNEVDLAGLADISQHGVYVWNYLVGAVTQTLKQAQDEITALLTAMRTRNVDGTTGQVALLTVALNGYATGVAVATGTARLLSVTANETGPTWDKLSLAFLVPQGFSYTA